MNQKRRLLASALAFAPLVARAQRGEAYTTLKNEVPVEVPPGKVEVAEFFWYGCIHCFNLEPVLETWIPKLPPEAHFRRIPAVFNERWAHDAAIFYSLEAMGLLEKLHKPLFESIHRDRLRTDNPEALSQWLAKNGVDAKKFEAAMKSFGVQSKVKRAAQITAAARIEGTPAMMVHGRYTISSEQGGSREGMLSNAERLVPIVRKTLASK